MEEATVPKHAANTEPTARAVHLYSVEFTELTNESDHFCSQFPILNIIQ